MWDKFTKVSVQVTIAVITVVASFGLLYLLTFKEVPSRNEKLLDILIGAVIGSTLTGVMGWLYSQSKNNKPPTP